MNNQQDFIRIHSLEISFIISAFVRATVSRIIPRSIKGMSVRAPACNHPKCFISPVHMSWFCLGSCTKPCALLSAWLVTSATSAVFLTLYRQ